MDSETLNDLLLNINQRLSWIVLWGDPAFSADEGPQIFSDHTIEHWFPMHPAAMKPGDILFVHRIKVKKLIFVAETTSSPRKAREEEVKKDPRQKRWMWSVDTRNLTPIYGAHWDEYSLKTFNLADEYNELNPQDQVNIRRLQFGAPVRISTGFARFLLNQIIRL
jgi:hypothetical protein